MAANGQSLPSGHTWENVHRSNAEQAQEWANLSKDEVLLPLRRDRSEAIMVVGHLDDAQLGTVTQTPLSDSLVSVQQMVEGMIAHAPSHLKSVRETTDKIVSA